MNKYTREEILALGNSWTSADPNFLTESAQLKKLSEDQTVENQSERVDQIIEEIKQKLKKFESVEFGEFLEKMAQSYDEIIATLEAFGFTDEVPSKREVIASIFKLDFKQLNAIEKFGKPTILITSPGDFASKVKAIDDHNKMIEPNDAHCQEPNNQIWANSSEKMEVTIVDGTNAMPRPDYINNVTTNGQKLEKYQEKFAEEGLEIMNSHQGAILIMKSLKEKQPIDDYDKTDTITYYKPENLVNAEYVACGCWRANYYRVYFRYIPLVLRAVALRCRPSVKLL